MRLTAGRAALVLGCSVRAVRRRAQRGELVSDRDKRGRLLITLPTEHRAERPSGRPTVRLTTRLAKQEYALARKLEQDAADLGDLRRLLRHLESQIEAMSADAAMSHDERQITSEEKLPWRPREPAGWLAMRDSKRGLGASLTITGVAALLAGILLHFALRSHAVDTAVHIGYFIGLVGLLSFLLGLLLVF